MSYAMPVSKNDDLNSVSNPLSNEVVIDGAVVSSLNPLPVTLQGIPEVITKVHDYKKTPITGNGTTDNHDYTVVGTKFRLKRVLLSAQSKFEGEVQVGPIISLATKAVAMVNTSKMTSSIVFDPPIDIVSGDIVRVIRRRFQTGTDEINTTIMGEDIA